MQRSVLCVLAISFLHFFIWIVRYLLQNTSLCVFDSDVNCYALTKFLCDYIFEFMTSLMNKCQTFLIRH